MENEWQSIDTAPLGETVWLWHRAWRHAFPGARTGDYGAVYIDTCETEARGWPGNATHWMPMSKPSE